MAMSRATDVDATWQYIAKGIDIIMVKDLANGGLTPDVYMKMYTTIHNHCVATNTAIVAPGAPTVPSSHHTPGSTTFRSHHTKLNGGDLYEKLCHCLKRYLEDVLNGALPQTTGRGGTDNGDAMALIHYYNKSWLRFTTGAKYLDHIFSYLNRHWVKQERDEGGRQRGVYEINTLCLVLWRDHLFMPLKKRLVSALIGQIEGHRDGHEVQVGELQQCIMSMVSIGLDDNNTKRTNLLFYSRNFEHAFIEATAAYYENESTQFISEHGVVPYMRRVAQRLHEEHARVAMYLHQSTEDLLIEECERSLIEAHQTAIQGEFLRLLAANRTEDVHILYTLLGKVATGLSPIKDMLKNYVEQVGTSAIEDLVAEQPSQDPKQVEPRAYIETLLKVYDRFDELVRTAFDGSTAMRKAIDDGCEVFINRNSIARPPESSAESRTPELLARFSDTLLKRSSRNTQDFAEIDESLNGIIRILRFVGEKDSFEKHYSRMLSRRLVHQTSANQDLETAMVSKLGDLYGFEYTNKLQRMFQDMATSQELRTHFREHATEDGDSSGDSAVSNFAPLVLAEGFWPLPYRDVQFNLPGELTSTIGGFEQYYNSIHSGRKLKWLWNFSKGELKVNFAQSTHILQVSVYQMAILLAFNELDSDSLTKETLLEHTSLPSEIFDGSMAYIVKAGVIIQDSNLFTINRDLKSRRVRINLNLPLKTDVRSEAKEVEKQLSEDRRMFLQAVMVRIMKARRELTHAQLVQETMQQASKRFQPSIRDIKRCITSLAEKEYIKRLGTDVYQYLA